MSSGATSLTSSAGSTISGGIFDVAGKEARLAAIEGEMAEPTFWDDAKRAQGLIRERNDLTRLVSRSTELQAELGELRLLWEMACEEGDESLEGEIQAGLARLRQSLRDFELTVVLSGEHDRKTAILSIHAGAGGTESQDWAQMLVRMYTRWAERHGYKVEVVDLLTEDRVVPYIQLVEAPSAAGATSVEVQVYGLPAGIEVESIEPGSVLVSM